MWDKSTEGKNFPLNDDIFHVLLAGKGFSGAIALEEVSSQYKNDSRPWERYPHLPVQTGDQLCGKHLCIVVWSNSKPNTSQQ